MQRLFNQLVPFLLLGVAIVAFLFGVMLMAYLFLFGAIIGMVLFIASRIRAMFFPKPPKPPARKGRIIDSDDWKKL